ncbi:MAG: Lrp/AsnC ligand binding domain-containing protein [Nitrososphaeraceae archaeon]
MALEQLMKIKEMKRYCKLFGMYDIVVENEAQTMQKLNEVITNKIKSLRTIRSTTTTRVKDEK